MNDGNRPNIVTVGLLAGAVVQMVIWGWNGWFADKPPLTAAEGAALTTILTALIQWIDRMSKRGRAHVIRKYTKIQ